MTIETYGYGPPPIGEIVLWAEESQGEVKQEWPAIVHAVNEDGTVNLTAFTDFGGGPSPDQGIERAPGDQPAAGCWRPRPTG